MTGMEAKDLERFHLSEGGTKHHYDRFHYLRNESGQYTVKAINDKANFEEILDSIKVLGFTANFDNIFKIVSCVMHMGNLDFDDSTLGNETACTITDVKLQSLLAELLQLTPEQVRDALTMK